MQTNTKERPEIRLKRKKDQRKMNKKHEKDGQKEKKKDFFLIFNDFNH